MRKLLLFIMFIGFSFCGFAQDSNGFINVKKVTVNIEVEMRYFTRDNFVGQKIDGYKKNACLLKFEAALALAQINKSLAMQNKRLKVLDCYRPQKAVDHFVRWVNDASDTHTKSDYYPHLDKSELLGDYIAEKSGHSRGYTVDLTIEERRNGRYQELDMGSNYDLFDAKSKTLNGNISNQQKSNRLLLKALMLENGFLDYPMEWWHFTFKGDPRIQYFNFDID